MNILFIIPPFGPIENYIPKTPGQKKTVLTIPYGILSIISYVNQKKLHNIRVFDCNKIILENLDRTDLEDFLSSAIKAEVLSFKPDIVGISALFNTSFSYVKFAEEIKSYHKTYMVIGGGLATNMYGKLFDEYPAIDAVCYGEGEIPFARLLETDLSVDASSLSPAWVTKESISKNIMPQYDFVQNLDDIPLIELDYIDYKKYNCRSYVVKDNTEEKVEISIHTSRGCPFNCVFCANSKLHGKQIRAMSVRRVIETIQHYKDRYGLTLLMVEDDHFLHNKRRALEVLQYIADNQISVEFPNGLSVYQIDENIASALKCADVGLVTLAIESGSDYVLKEVIDKPLNKAMITRAIHNLQQHDIKIHAFIVIGIPGELDEHREETIDLLLQLGVDWAYIFIATPIVGSRLYQICEDNGYLTDAGFDNHVVTKGNIKAPGIDPKKIEDYSYYMHVVINFLGNSNIKKGQYKRAEEYFLRVIASYPREAIAHFMLAKLYMLMDLPEKAKHHRGEYLKHYDEYIGRFQNDPLWMPLIREEFKK